MPIASNRRLAYRLEDGMEHSGGAPYFANDDTPLVVSGTQDMAVPMEMGTLTNVLSNSTSVGDVRHLYFGRDFQSGMQGRQTVPDGSLHPAHEVVSWFEAVERQEGLLAHGYVMTVIGHDTPVRFGALLLLVVGGVGGVLVLAHAVVVHDEPNDTSTNCHLGSVVGIDPIKTLLKGLDHTNNGDVTGQAPVRTALLAEQYVRPIFVEHIVAHLGVKKLRRSRWLANAG